MARKKLIILNWKMEFTHNQAITWLDCYGNSVLALSQDCAIDVVICPPFTCLGYYSTALKNRGLFLGAQDCSEYLTGAYTAGISVLSLRELDCSYCIIGHSERRRYYNETDIQVAQKIRLALRNGVEPIVCVGETLQERHNNQIIQALERQLQLVLEIAQEDTVEKLNIAYEPVWAIGSGRTPTQQELESVLSWIQKYSSTWGLQDKLRILYGGSVNERTVSMLKQVTNIDGFLLGKASLDFQILKKTVLLLI